MGATWNLLRAGTDGLSVRKEEVYEGLGQLCDENPIQSARLTESDRSGLSIFMRAEGILHSDDMRANLLLIAPPRV